MCYVVGCEAETEVGFYYCWPHQIEIYEEEELMAQWNHAEWDEANPDLDFYACWCVRGTIGEEVRWYYRWVEKGGPYR